MGLEMGSGSCWQLSAAGERKDLEIPGNGLGRDLRCDEHTDIVVLLTFQILDDPDTCQNPALCSSG